MGSENNAAACADGLDNDCDGFADCNDLNCSCQGTCPPGRRAPPGCMCSGPESENCSDGRDNDCNGFVDSMDFACQPRDAGTDAARDAPVRRDTVGCDSGGAMENSPTACSDGLDNDCDGFVDCDDRNCSCVGSCGPADNAPPGCICRGAEGASNATCSDRIDNDCNTFVDCADFACSRNPSITVCPRDGGSGG
jgi:hypothetical protein